MRRTRHRSAPRPRGVEGPFRALAEAAPFGLHFYRLERNGRLVFTGANPAADRILGIHNADLVGLTIEEAFPPLCDTEVPARYREAAREGTAWNAEQVRFEHGRIAGAFEVHAFQTRRGEMAAAFQDITERKRTEQSLHANLSAERRLLESQARLRAVLRSVPVVQWALDDEGVFALSEGLGLAALGLRPGEAVGRRVEELFGAYPGVLSDFRRALSGETFVSENRIGALVFESHWAPMRDDGGAIVGVTGIARDVTAERALRDQVFQAQKLEGLGRLAGGVAHDFNNLLTVVLSCTEVLRDDAAAGRPASAEDVEQIAAAGERARDLVRQLLAFARKQVMAPAPTDLGAVLRGSEKLLRRLLGEDLELRVEAEPGLWPVLCDPSQLEQVLMNLAINARDAMPRGGRLTIHASNVAGPAGSPEAGTGEPAGWVKLLVRDNGMGMSEEVKAHVFEPFFTTKEPGAGTGLGLATVYGVVAQSGGKIQVESEPGVGTTFEIRLPRCAQPALPPSSPSSPDRVGGSEAILVVEDEPLVRSITSRTLRDAGYRVLVAADAREALELAGSAELDLVVSDVVMPDMTGPMLARMLAERRTGLRVLFVSGYSRQAVAERGLEGGTPDYLQKPFTASALLQRVRQVLDG